MGKQWNEAQKEAITTRHRNILVSASAGSGKTGVLVQRLVELVILDHIEIDEILAMTFSEDAASEMKKRLSKEINQLVLNEKDENNRQYLFSQLSKLSNAHISTIHSFCYSIIKDYYYLLGLSAKRISNLCVESTQKIYQDQALEEVMAIKQKEKKHSFYQLCAMLSSRPENLQPVKDIILKTASMADSQSDPEIWLDEALAAYNLDTFEKDTKVRQVFLDYWKGKLQTYQQCFDTIRQQFEEHYPDEEKKIHAFYKKYDLIRDIHLVSDFDEFSKQILVCAKQPVPTSPDSQNIFYKEARDEIIAIEDEVLAVPPTDVMKKMTHEIIDIVSELIDCVRLYFKHYEAIKNEKEVIDFSDMEHMALRLLKEFPRVAEHYRSLFKEIMVDEFQDSNDVQDELVRLICREDNVFRVGDVKQSIYGFRHALPQIMQSYKEKEDAYNKVIRFNKNYRSDATIVEFNNVLYEILMNIEGFDSLPFKSEDLSEIGLASQKEDNQPIVFHALDPNLKTYADEKINKDIYKAEYIAHEIIRQSKDHEFKDFAVLVRSNAKMEVLKKVFEKYHIPYYMNQKSGFYESRSIQILLSMLNALCDPENDFHFAAILTSIFFQFDSDSLAKISQKKNKSYYQCLKEQTPQVLHEFERIRNSSYTIRQMIQECFKWNHFYDTCSFQDQTNCDYFYELACDYEENISCECINFLTYIDSLKDQQTAQTSTIGKNDNVVRFMSIHNSKGLEFPIVYLWSTSHMKKMELSDMVLCDNELGIGMNIMQFPYRNVFKSYQRIAIEHKKNRDELEEELRILYVATTRAKKQLHIVDFLDPKLDIDHGITYSKVNARKGTTSWILQAMNHLHKDHLFRIHYVDHLWETAPLEKMKTSASLLPRYKDTQVIEILSPSETETIDFGVHPLSFRDSDAAHRGTTYHAYLEHLPSVPWNETLIHEISAKYHLDMDDRLLFDLMKLNQNEIFRSLQHTQIYHEYPFLVQDGTTILHGYMDFLSIGDVITLIDFKSDAVEDESILIDRYTSQLTAYTKACRLLFKDKMIRTYIYSFSLSEMIEMKS